MHLNFVHILLICNVNTQTCLTHWVIWSQIDCVLWFCLNWTERGQICVYCFSFLYIIRTYLQSYFTKIEIFFDSFITNLYWNISVFFIFFLFLYWFWILKLNVIKNIFYIVLLIFLNKFLIITHLQIYNYTNFTFYLFFLHIFRSFVIYFFIILMI